MSRGTQVKFEDVRPFARPLLRESVSFAKVYQRIGSRGGQQVVTDMIRRWRQEECAAGAGRAMVNLCWHWCRLRWFDCQPQQQALAQAQQRYLQQAEVLAQREVEWQQKLDAAQASVDQVGRENLEIKAELARAQGELQAREVAHQELVELHQGFARAAGPDRTRAGAGPRAGGPAGGCAGR